MITPGQAIMIGVSCVLLYLAIAKGFEPLLLMPIGFGMLLVNLPGTGIMLVPFMIQLIHHTLSNGGLLYLPLSRCKIRYLSTYYLYGVGAMTDFGPLIANPKTLLMGAAAQLGIFGAFIGVIIRIYSSRGFLYRYYRC